METIRRSYLYVLSGITLAMLAVGVRLLLVVLFDALRLGGDAVSGRVSREQLSQAAALVGVGLPAWAIHWWLVGRQTSPGAPGALRERSAPVRAAYLSIVLAVSLGFAASAAIDLLRAWFASVLGAPAAEFPAPDPSAALATILSAALPWVFHASVRRGDEAATPMTGAAAWWPRVYVAGVAFVALNVLMAAGGDLLRTLELIIEPTPGLTDRSGLDQVVAASLGAIVVAAPLAVTHLWYGARLRRADGWRGVSQRASIVRVALFLALLLEGVAYALADAANAGRAGLAELLGVSGETGFGALSIGRDLAVPLMNAVLWLVVAILARRRLLWEASSSGIAGRAAQADRLDRYGVALVGLAYGASGIGWLLGFAFDALLGTQRAAGASGRYELASVLPLAILGAALWAWRWSGVVTATAVNPVAEARSGIRRGALLLALGVSVVASAVSLALLLYRAFGTALGVAFADSTISDLTTPAGALIAAGSVAIYHLVLVQGDTRRAAAEIAGSQASTETAWTTETARIGPTAPAPGGSPPAPGLNAPAPAGLVRRSLTLTAPSNAEADAAIAAARSVLPPGASLTAE